LKGNIAIGLRVLAPADKADSTANLWAISLVYVAAPGTEFPEISSVDKAGVKIGTFRGAPSDRVFAGDQGRRDRPYPSEPTIAADAADLLRSGNANVLAPDSGVGYPAADALWAPRSCRAPLGPFTWPPRCRKAALPRTSDTRRRSNTDRRGAESDRREGPQGRECRHEMAGHSPAAATPGRCAGRQGRRDRCL
jgi:hypothetical protein